MRKRLLFWTTIILAAVLIGGMAVRRALRTSGDFDGFHRAVTYVWENGSFPSDKSTERYPPTFQFFLAPLGALPIGVAAALWVLLNYACIAATPPAFEQLSCIPPREQALAWFVVLPFLVDNVILGQTGPILVFLTVAGLALAQNEHGAGGGIMITMAALLKVIPGCFLAIPVILYRARKTLFGAAAVTLVAVTGMAYFFGTGEIRAETRRWITETRAKQTPWDLVENNRSLRYNNQGLAVTLARNLHKIPGESPENSVRLASLPLPVAWSVYGIIALTAAVLWGLSMWKTRRSPTPRAWLGLLALTAIFMLIVSPIVWTHYFLWLLPAFIYLINRKNVLIVVGLGSWVALAITPARALGFHMLLALFLFVLISRDFLMLSSTDHHSQTKY